MLAQYVYRPLGLHDTSLPKTVAMPRPFMHGYDLEDGGPPEDVSTFINPRRAGSCRRRATSGGSSAPTSAASCSTAPTRAARSGGSCGTRTHRRRAPAPTRPGLALFRYRTRCGTVYGHTGSFPGYRLFGRLHRQCPDRLAAGGEGAADLTDDPARAGARGLPRAARLRRSMPLVVTFGKIGWL